MCALCSLPLPDENTTLECYMSGGVRILFTKYESPLQKEGAHTRSLLVADHAEMTHQDIINGRRAGGDLLALQIFETGRATFGKSIRSPRAIFVFSTLNSRYMVCEVICYKRELN